MATADDVMKKLQEDQVYQSLIRDLNQAKRRIIDVEAALIQRSIELALETTRSSLILP